MQRNHNLTVILLAGIAAVQGCQASHSPSPQPLQTTAVSPTPTEQTTPATPAPQTHEQIAVAPEAPAAVVSHPVVAPPPAPAATPNFGSDQVVARLRGEPITLDKLIPLLVEGYGLDILQHVANLEATKQEARRHDVTVTSDDVKAEFDLTVSKLFVEAEKPDYERLLEQFLEKQHYSRAEFNLVVEANAYLRKMAMLQIKDKLTDDVLKEAYLQMYGEKVQIRHIELANMQEVIDVQRMLNAGQPFEQVARLKSHNERTAGLGGELPPFSRTAEYPQSLKDLAFSLKEGQVSAPLNVQGTYQILKLESRIAPKAVKFEEVKESVRESVLERASAAAMQQFRAAIAEDARKELSIDLPVLKAQYEAKLQHHENEKQLENKAKAEWDARRKALELNAAAQEPTTQPVNATPVDPSTPAAPVLPAPGVAQPPATKSEAPSGSGVSDIPEVIPQ